MTAPGRIRPEPPSAAAQGRPRDAMRALRDARLRRGWTLTRAAAETGISGKHLSLLERGLRRPSESLAEDIISAYRMTDAEADAVAGAVIPDGMVIGSAQRKILCALNDAGDKGITTTDLVGFRSPDKPLAMRQRAVGDVLHRLRRNGLAARSGQRGGARGGTYRWYITAAGIIEAARPSPAERREQSAAKRRQRAAVLAAARTAGHGHSTPPPKQRDVMLSLRAAGCTLTGIGDLFGVSRETVRLRLASKTERACQ